MMILRLRSTFSSLTNQQDISVIISMVERNHNVSELLMIRLEQESTGISISFFYGVSRPHTQVHIGTIPTRQHERLENGNLPGIGMLRLSELKRGKTWKPTLRHRERHPLAADPGPWAVPLKPPNFGRARGHPIRKHVRYASAAGWAWGPNGGGRLA